MTNKLSLRFVVVGVATLLTASLSGCLLPCEICLACANAGTSAEAVSHHDHGPIKEVGPQLQQTAWKNAVAH